jgi:hypothetical protein
MNTLKSINTRKLLLVPVRSVCAGLPGRRQLRRWTESGTLRPGRRALSHRLQPASNHWCSFPSCGHSGEHAPDPAGYHKFECGCPGRRQRAHFDFERRGVRQQPERRLGRAETDAAGSSWSRCLMRKGVRTPRRGSCVRGGNVRICSVHQRSG